MKKQKSFFEKVHEVARMIPYGRVTSYGAIAKHLGSPQSARMVGWAMNNSFHANPPVPAHRVLNRNGMLTGKEHFGSPTMMQQLLENEGIRVVDDCVADWEKVFWEPGKGRKKRKDFWDDLSDAQKKSIEKAIRQADRGKVISHKKAMKKYRNL